jgi:transglutaminase-like putative cysteine protease
MARRFEISHVTRYTFDREVAGLHLSARLRPLRTGRQGVAQVDVSTVPPPQTHTAGEVDGFAFAEPLTGLTLRAQSTVVIDPNSGIELAPPGGPEPEADLDAHDPLIRAWASETLPGTTPELDHIRGFCQRLRRDFAFDPAATTHATTIREFFVGCRGVCEDFARLATACLRARGVPVRHVVGYLLPAPGGSSFRRQAHAWISVWIPETGWIDLDPTTGLAAPDHHVTVARGYDHLDTAPVTGRLTDGKPAGQQLAVDVSIVET